MGRKLKCTAEEKVAAVEDYLNGTIEALGDMYENYNLVMATSYGL